MMLFSDQFLFSSHIWLILFVWQDIGEMVHTERPDWQSVMTYVTAIYKYFETWEPSRTAVSAAAVLPRFAFLALERCSQDATNFPDALAANEGSLTQLFPSVFSETEAKLHWTAIFLKREVSGILRQELPLKTLQHYLRCQPSN